MRYFMAFILAAFLCAPAYAAFQGPGSDQQGGFKGPGSALQTSTVAQVNKMPDDSFATLEGHIISQLPGSKDKYMFKDATGEIRIEIDHKYFMGREVTPQNKVRITGEVDHDFGKAVELDVKNLEILN